MFKCFDNKFNSNMKSQLTKNLRDLPAPSFKKIKTETEYNFKRIENKRSFHFNVNILDNIQQSIHVGNNETTIQNRPTILYHRLATN